MSPSPFGIAMGSAWLFAALPPLALPRPATRLLRLALLGMAARACLARPCALADVHSPSSPHPWHFDVHDCSSLDLSGSSDAPIVGDGMRALARMLMSSSAAQLTTLNLSGANIGDEGVGLLANALEQSQKVSTLLLGMNGISDVGVLRLSRVLASRARISVLSLVENPIRDAGAAALGEAIKKNQELTSLDLGDTNIGEAGAAALAEGLASSTALISLYVSGAGEEAATALMEGLTCNQAGKGHEIECKASLVKYVEESRGLIDSAVQVLAVLEERLQQVCCCATHQPISCMLAAHVSLARAQQEMKSTKSVIHEASGEVQSIHPSSSEEARSLAPPPTVSVDELSHPAASSGEGQSPPATSRAHELGAEHEKELAERAEVVQWMHAHKLSLAEQLPMLEALGVKRVSGRFGSLMALRSLSFSDLSSELAMSGVEFDCGKRCTANKAGLFQALRSSDR
ncbi:MAG: hypothetical protein SGPRY_011656 [Prymnesium sp.]